MTRAEGPPGPPRGSTTPVGVVTVPTDEAFSPPKWKATVTEYVPGSCGDLTDLAARKLAEGKVVWTVKAPQEPGTYSITVAFHFGGEKASSVGTVTTPTGVVLPRGGPGGPSARVMFARPVMVTVR